MKYIISPNNQEIKNLKLLKDDTIFIAQGMRTIGTIIDSGRIQLKAIYVKKELLEEVQKFCPDEFITIVSQEALDRISSQKTASGILAVFYKPIFNNKIRINSGIVLCEISDPGNMGTLIRTAAAFDNKNIFIIGGCNPWSDKVVQSCAGTIANVNIIEISWQELAKAKGDLKLCALVAQNGENIENISQSGSLVIIGNEAHGINPKWLAQCQSLVTIPMNNNVESLNAAVAGSIALYLLSKK